jgi:nicotinic acid mononucleotide adenylyltransferase
MKENKFINFKKKYNLSDNYTKEDLNKLYKKKKKKKHFKKAYKILKDKLYSKLYFKEKSLKEIEKAGFFFDNMKIKKEKEEKQIFISTPINKLKNPKRKKKNVVLLSTGAFSPLHIGHIEMMKMAKKEIEKAGYKVIGGYISPSHDEYVDKKNNGTASFNIAKRIYLMEKILENHKWLMIDKWEAYYNKKAINFTDVIYHIEKYIKKYFNNDNIEIIYVYGDDNQNFSKVFEGTKYKSICVQRINKKKEKNQKKNTIFVKNKKEKLKTISSTKIREGKIEGIEEKLYKKLKEEQKNRNKKRLEYYIREDVGNKKILKKFEKILQESFKKNIINFHIETLKKQKTIIKELVKNSQTISIDRKIKADYNISVSREFDISNSQIKSQKIKISNSQIKQIKKGKYILIEDDIDTGNTIKYFKRKLPNKVKIKKMLILNKLLNNNKYYDVLDLRDFIIGEEYSGIKTKYKNQQVRVPYILPFISPATRAKIPYDEEKNFSIKIWKLNKEIYKNQKIKKLKNKEFQKLLYLIGFNKNDKIAKVCNFHIKKLRN